MLNISWACTPNPLKLNATPSSTTQVGQPYSQANVAQYGTAPYTYSLFAGTLPAGTTLDTSTGTVSGTPSAVGAFSYTIEVTDNSSPVQTATAATSGTMVQDFTTTSVTSSLNPSDFNQPVTFTATVTGFSPTGTVSFFDNGNPTAIGTGTLNQSSPDQATFTTSTLAAGIGSHTITATYNSDTLNATSSGSLTGNPQVVNSDVAAAQAIASTALTINHVATAFIPVTGSGGTGALTYSVLPALPTGLSMDGPTGQVSGTPTVTHAASSFTVTVTDANGVSASNSFSLTVNSAVTATPAVPSSTLTLGHAATPFTPVTGGGGTAPLSYSVSPPLLASLSMAPSTGTISGTPTISSAATPYTVTVTDANGATATAGFTLTVNSALTAALVIPSETLIQNQAAAPFTPVVGNNGTPPLSYAVSPPLPTGLSMAPSTGTISGTPTVTSPATNYTVTVTDANSATATAAFGLTVNGGPPTVTSVSPNSGPTAGGTSVTITGTNFTGATGVSFGGVAATNVNIVSNTSITATSPAGNAGQVDVTVTNAGGTSATSVEDGFTYAAAPTVTAITPNSGPAAGGTSVTVTGTNFTGATALKFGSTNATLFTVDNATSITAISPAGSAGAVDVTVTTGGGTSATGAADRFTYQPAATAPTVSAVSPNGGPTVGGSSVTIAGTNLSGATAVAFGTNNATSFTVNSATSISAISPAGASGPVDVTVTTPNGTSAVSAADRFTYTAQRMGQQGDKLVGSGAAGPANQGDAVSLSGDGNTALVGGDADNAGVGAAWVFARSNGTWSQVGSKLVGSGNTGAANEGFAVVLSSDGSTALVGGPRDNSGVGAVWVFTQSGGVWTQQAKLTASDESGAGTFGTSVALSANGNTALIGGSADNGNAGAAWIFSRSGTSWTQQGSKLVGNGAVGNAGQGTSVALSANATTALVGGANDNAGSGAVWVFAQSGGVWSQQGTKLTGSGASGAANQGSAVSLSADGNTALIGGAADNSGTGAAWVFTQSGGVWSQVGQKLVGTGAAGNPRQGFAVALSADANTAAIGGYDDTSLVGAVWAFGNSGGAWTQKGGKLVGTGNVGAAEQGFSVALSANGTTLLEGGPFDASGNGAAWVFIPAPDAVASHDFNGDGKSDILWEDTSGDVALWLMNGASIVQSAGVGTVSPAVWSIAGQRDFNGDGNADILWHDTSGDVAIWFMNGATITQSLGIGNANPSVWSIVGTGDFFGDGNNDILWHDTSGDVAIWEVSAGSVTKSCGVGTAPTAWSIAGTGDFNGDGYTDILWRDTAGDVAIWEMNGCSVIESAGVGNAPTSWSIAGTGDFNGDGMSDILWHDTSGDVSIWEMNGTAILQSSGVGTANPSVWSIAQTGDYYGAGTSDILWRDTSGDVAVWQLNGATITQSAGIGTAPPVWSIQDAGAD